MNNIARVKKIICCGILLVVVPSLTACKKESTLDFYKRAYNLNLPQDTVLEFFGKSGGGDYGFRYVVFRFETEPTEFIADFIETTIPLKNGNWFYPEGIEIPENFLPNWNQEFIEI